jgi:Leucine-rich repeat (LRR) protein
MRSFLLLFAATFAFGSHSRAQCISCYSLEEALLHPETVEHLHLSNQGITTLPAAFERFHNLRTLDLSNNSLFSFPEFPMHFSQLTVVDLSNNPGFNTFTLDAFFSGSPEIIQLNLSRCNMRYVSPCIGNLKKLQQLDLSHNALLYLPEPFQQLEKLQVLQLADNQLRNIHLLTGTLWKLTDLDVSVNPKLELNALLTSLSVMDGLQTLRISPRNAKITPAQTITTLPVQHLIFEGAAVSDLSGSMRANPFIQQISFENCTFPAPDKLVPTLNDIPALHTLSFKKCEIPPAFVHLDEIDTLLFSDCLMATPKDLLKMKQLKNLNLSEQDLDPEIINQLQTGLDQTSVDNVQLPMDASMLSNDLPALVPGAPVVKLIDAQQPQVLKYENTQLDVPANGFLNSDGTLYTGTVQVEVSEYFDPITMALAGAPMVFNTGTKDELFSSSGMIEVNAKDPQGNVLTTNPAAVIQVQIKNAQPQQNSNLYTFNAITNNWQQNTQSPTSIGFSERVRQLMDSLNQLPDTAFIDVQPIPSIVYMKFKSRRIDPSEISFSNRDYSYRSRVAGNTFYYYLKNYRQAYLSEQVWKLDTLVSPEYVVLLKKIKKSQKAFEKGSKKYNYNVMPRLIRNLEIRPDFERDHFVLSFRYKDSLVQLPVYLTASDASKLIKKQGQFYKEHEKRAAKDAADIAKFKKSRDEALGKAAMRIKEQITSNIIAIENRQAVIGLGNNLAYPDMKEMLSFGLKGFGIVNCDFFFRNPPKEFLALGQQVRDQNNIAIQVPAVVRNVIFRGNTYAATSSQNVPFYGNGKSVVLFPNGDDELIVVRCTKDQYTARRLNIKDKKAAEVKQMILHE